MLSQLISIISGNGMLLQQIILQLCFSSLCRKNIDYLKRQFAVGSISTIVDSVCDSIKESVKNSLDLNSCFDFEDPFSSLQTEYQQTKFYREEFGLVVCIIINWLNNNSSFCHNYRNQLQWN